jgi:hypothetical protein
MISRAIIAVMTAALLGSCATTASHRTVPAETDDARRILVMIADPGNDRLDLRGARSGAYRQARVYSGTPSRVARVLEEIASEFRLEPVEGWPMRSLGIHCTVFDVGPGASVDAVLARLGADDRVESVQRMQEFELQASGTSGAWDDPYLSLQRSLRDLEITRAHRWSTGRGVRIAVIDTGIDAQHPDLRGQVAEVRNFVADDAGSPDRHGTAVAGVIASVAGNHRGIVGVAPGARLLALQACTQRDPDGRGRCTSFSLARALDHAIWAGSDVVNLSLGGPRDLLLERLLGEALGRNIVVVAARGDDHLKARFPATLRGVIAVGGPGAPVESGRLAAPDIEVLTLVPPDGYDFLSGSSMAAAHVSGVVALLLERDPELQASRIESLLARTSRPVGDGRADHRSVVSACDALAELSSVVHCGADDGAERVADAAGQAAP